LNRQHGRDSVNGGSRNEIDEAEGDLAIRRDDSTVEDRESGANWRTREGREN